MTELVGHVTAKQIASSRDKLADAVRNALWNDRMSHGHRDPFIVARDLDAVLEAASELLHVIGEHIRPQCSATMPGMDSWRCFRPENHKGRHGDGLVSWG